MMNVAQKSETFSSLVKHLHLVGPVGVFLWGYSTHNSDNFVASQEDAATKRIDVSVWKGSPHLIQFIQFVCVYVCLV